MWSRFTNQSEFTRNILKLVSGAAFAQIITMGVSPILTRLYSEDQFGEFAIVTSIFSVIALIAGGRFEVALLLPKKRSSAANLFTISFFTNVIVSIILVIVLILMGLVLDSELTNWFFIIPLFVLFVTGIQIMNAWFNREKKYNAIAINRISSAVFNNGLAVVFGFFHIPINGLLLSNLIAGVLTVGVGFSQLKQDRKYILDEFSIRKSKVLVKKYKHFPMVNTFQALLDGLQINGLVYLISFLFGTGVVGVFSLSIRMLYAPANFIGSALAQVFYQETSEAYNNKKSLLPIVKKTLIRTIFVMSIFLITILLFGPQLFAFIFGKDWYMAGVYAQYIAPWVCLDFIRSPLSQIPLIFNRQRKMLLFSSIGNLITLGFIIIMSFYLKEIQVLLLGISILQFFSQLVLILWILGLIKKYENDLK